MPDNSSHPPKPERITLSSVGAALFRVINLEKGFLHTLIALTFYPGAAIREYLFDDRTRLSKAFGFLFFFTAVAAFATVQFLDLTDMSNMNDQTWSYNEQTMAIIQEFNTIYMKYMNPIMLTTIPITSLFTYYIFKKPRLNVAEHLVINSYLFAYQSFVYLLLIPLMMYDTNLGTQFYFLVVFIYTCYAFIKIYDYPPFEGIMRNLLVTVLTYGAFFLLLFIAIFIFMAIKLSQG